MNTPIGRVHLLRSAVIAAVVGTWLTLFNQWHVLVGGNWDSLLAVRVGLNFATPFAVSLATSVWNAKRGERPQGLQDGHLSR